MDYMIIQNKNPNRVESMVLKFISEGRELLGGVSVSMDKNNYIFAQAIIKKGV